MKTIIQQILIETTKKYLNYYEENGIIEISRMAEDFKLISEEMAKELLSTFIEIADKEICEAKAERKADKITIHEKHVERTLYTALGSFSYNRTYFNVPNGRSYLLDKILGVAAYERIDAGVSANLVNHSAIHSYGRSADIVTGGQISRQSVRNKLINTGEVAYIPDKKNQTPETLHIFADEDHVNLQNGKNTIVPLITVCEGKKSLSKGRNELIEPFHVQGYGMKSEDFWKYVYALCAEKYDIEAVKNVYIYGDGGAWIKTSNDVFSDAIHVLDIYHQKKRLRSLFSGEICSNYSLSAHQAIRGNDKVGFDKIVQAMLNSIDEKMFEGQDKKRKVKRVLGNASYIMKHWDAIQNAKNPATIGSCTEAMISHVLSARLSRNPMGWSKEGLSKITMVRVFVLNGGQVEAADTLAWKHNDKKHSVVATYEKYNAIVKKQQENILKDVKSWRWFETDDLISGKTTGTSVVLEALGKTRNIA